MIIVMAADYVKKFALLITYNLILISQYGNIIASSVQLVFNTVQKKQFNGKRKLRKEEDIEILI
ncbi:hypothetical protein CBE01nite_42940 [Clostridium beijerinckii]|nr:hypothetical protein CBE01nite_42940 [Clostridium beijerinckii]